LSIKKFFLPKKSDFKGFISGSGFGEFMQYKYLEEWMLRNESHNLVLNKILKFENQYALFFFKNIKNLQINLSSENSFCFFTKLEKLPFTDVKELRNFNSHLNNARFEKITIFEKDKILDLYFSKIDIYNRKNEYHLLIELIPHYQNIILLKENKVIIDCLKKVSFAENRFRQILPGIQYEPPPAEYENLKEKIKYPLAFAEKGKIVEGKDVQGSFDDINKLFEQLYYEHIFVKRKEKLKQQKISNLKKKIKKKKLKIEKLDKEFSNAKDEEKWKQFAELLKANFQNIKSGMDFINVKNYYHEGFPDLKIPLFSEKNTRQNIDFYFKKYRKAKTGKKIIALQIKKAKDEIGILNKEVQEIQESEFFLNIKKEEKSKFIKEKKKYRKFKIDKNWEIFIGRTNKENDLLTTKLAKPHDWWFHTRIFHGTHVILRNFKKKELPENLKMICCKLAAYYSKAKKSTNVPVDYTQIRYVRKPRSSPAGYVVYSNQRTLFVDPISMREAIEKVGK